MDKHQSLRKTRRQRKESCFRNVESLENSKANERETSHHRKKIIMIQEKINQLVAVLQALTMQRANALRLGNMSEAQQIASVAVDVDAKIHELQQSLRLIKS